MSTMPIFAPTETRSFGPDNTYRWATVTQLDPLRVRFDGDTAPIPVTPETLISPTLLVVGSRVWVQMFGRRLIVLGAAGGETEDTGWVDLTPAAGFTSNAAQVRRIGKLVRFHGSFTGTLAATTTTQIATVPAGFRPTVLGNNFGIVTTSGGFVGWSNVTLLGVFSVHIKTPYAGGSAVIDITATSYTID